MKKKILVLIVCLLFVNLSAFSAQVRKRTGYSTYSTSKDKMVTTYYLVNSNGQRVSTQEYDYLNEINSNLFIAQNDLKVGLINGYGRGILPFEYQEIRCLKSGVLKVKKDNKYGLMTFTGLTILPIRYSYLEKLDDRLLKFTSGDSSSSNGLPMASGTTSQRGSIGLMDYRGNIIANEQYYSVDKINNYLLRVRLANATDASQQQNPQNAGGAYKYGLIDYSGRVVLKPQYDYISKINNTILRLKMGNSWGRAEYYNGNIINVMFDYQSYW